MKKHYPDKNKELEEALLNYIGEKYLKILKQELRDKRNYLMKKLAYQYEYFNSIDDYHKPVDNLKNEYFFSKIKNDYHSYEVIERTKEIIKLFNIKNGEELIQIYLKSDVLLLTCAFEKIIKVSVNEFILIHCIVLVYVVILGDVF